MISLRDAYTAQPDDDFDLPSVVRPRPQARTRRAPAKPQRKPGVGERLASYALNHPRQVLAAVFLAGCGGVIAWNALVLQRAHHPAPLFSQRAAAPESGPEFAPEYTPAPALSQPLPPARPGTELSVAEVLEAEPPHSQAAVPVSPAPRAASRGAIAELIRNGGDSGSAARPVAKASTAPAQAVAAAPAPARAPTVRDPIAEIIRMGGPVPTPPANVGRSDAGDLVLSGQRALARLGYGVKVDGMMGAGTRQAIERFEQDRRLPVTGEFGPRTVRELSAVSGIMVQ